MVFPGARLFRAPIWCTSGGGCTREAGSTVAESLVAFYRVGTHQRAARSSMSQTSAELLRARIKGANREVSKGKAALTTVCFLPMRANKERRTGKIRGFFFRDAQGFGRLDASSRAGFSSSRPPPRWTSVFHFSVFLYFCVTLRNLGLFIKTDWSVICLLCG